MGVYTLKHALFIIMLLVTMTYPPCIGFRSRCLDIDECLQSSPPCSHQCENTPGGYRCLCPDGARLNSRGVCESGYITLTMSGVDN